MKAICRSRARAEQRNPGTEASKECALDSNSLNLSFACIFGFLQKFPDRGQHDRAAGIEAVVVAAADFAQEFWLVGGGEIFLGVMKGD